MPETHVQNLIVGQGLAGSAIAWQMHWQGQSLVIVDDEQPATASRVSAGLITPYTGKRMAQAPDYAQDWQAAVEFYRRVEQVTGRSFFSEEPMYRLRVPESQEFPRKSIKLTGQERPFDAVCMEPAARLDVGTYLEATRNWFTDRGQYYCQRIDLSRFSIDQPLKFPGLAATADVLILATGAAKTALFPDVPNNPSRGDILDVRIDGYSQTRVVHAGIWIAPDGDQQRVGSTYDWEYLENQPTETGRQEIAHRLADLVDAEVSLIDHRAAIRPTMKDYLPVLGRHLEHASVWILNGLGSKGSLRAPRAAAELTARMRGQEEISRERCVSRIRPAERQRPLTQRAQQIVGKALRTGDFVIDATVGNGFDTCFLAESVGTSGRVLGFDLQQQAIDSTRKRLEAKGLENVRLIKQGHETLTREAESGVAAVMFNLGYLPRADKSVITRASTTIPALEGAIAVLRPGGVLTVLCYRGHDGGPEEFNAVHNLLSGLPENYDLERFNSQPDKPTAPVLLVVRKHENA